MTTLVANTFETIGLDGIANWFKKLGAVIQRRREIKTTIRQLSALSNRELNDMGISRGDIYGIAHGTFHREYSDTKVNRNLNGWV
jgi:uncharacterized protein YjiS (DUF1127 family)